MKRNRLFGAYVPQPICMRSPYHFGYYICQYCFDAGCLACENEIRKHEAQVTEHIRNWRPLTEKEISRIVAIANSFHPPLGDDDKRLLITAAQMPPQLFRCERDDQDDVAALKRVFGANALQETFTDGVTPAAMEIIYERAEKERILQRLRKMRQVPARKTIML